VLNLAEWQRHAFINRLQSVLLLSFMAGFLALLGYLVGGRDGLVYLAVLGLFLLFMNPVAAPWLVLRLYRTRPFLPAEAPTLYALLRELSRRAELPTLPTLHYVPSPLVNAFTVGGVRNAAIALTEGLLLTLDGREIAGVLAHEISHIRNGDLRVLGLADLISRLTSFLSLFGQLLLLVNLPLLWWPDIRVNWWAIALLVFAPQMQITVLAQLGLSRAREYDADLNAVLLTGDPEGLASAFAKIERGRRRWFEVLLPGFGVPEPSWLRTHPPRKSGFVACSHCCRNRNLDCRTGSSNPTDAACREGRAACRVTAGADFGIDPAGENPHGRASAPRLSPLPHSQPVAGRPHPGDRPVCGRCRELLFGGQPVALTAADFDLHAVHDDIDLVVDSWCAPCRMTTPVFEQAARLLEPRFRLAKINTKEGQGLAAPFGIRNIPTLALFRHGRELALHAGTIGVQDIVRWVRTHA
jgi:heat shock protein HtpX